MKTVVKYISTWLVLLAFGQIITAQSSLNRGETLLSTISLDEFVIEEKGKSNYYTGLLSKQIPFMLSIPLRDYGYQIKWTQQLIAESAIDQKNKYRQQEQGIDNNLLINNGVLYTITGTFKFINETNLDIDIQLSSLSENGTMESLNNYILYIYSLNELNSGLNSIGAQINREIQASKSADKNKTVALVCYDIIPFEGAKVDSYLSEDMALSTYYNIKDYALPGIAMVDWEIAKPGCGNPFKLTLIQRSKNLDADLFIHGEIKYLDALGNYRVTPQIFIKSKNRSVIIPGPVKNNMKFYDLQRQTSSYIIFLIDEIIDDDGKYNTQFLNILLDSDASFKISEIEKYYYEEKFEVAAILSQSILQIDPNHKDALFWLAKCKTQLHEFDEANQIFTLLATSYPEWPDVHFQLGIIYKAQTKDDLAVEEFEKVMELDDQYPDLNYQLGLTYYLKKEYDRATDSFEKQLAQNNNDVESWYYMALSFLEKGIEKEDYDEKINAYKQANETVLSAQNVFFGDSGYMMEDLKNLRYTILQEYGNTTYKAEKYEESILYFKESIKINLDRYGLNMLRFNYSNLDEYEEVDMIINEGLENGIYQYKIYFDQAQDLRAYKDETGNYSSIKLEMSLVYLDKYLEFSLNNPEALRLKGSTYFRLGLLDHAIEQYLLSHQFENDPIQKSKILLDIAEISIMKGNYHEALENLDKLKNRNWIDGDRSSNSIRCLDLYLSIASKYLLNQEIGEEEAILEEYLEKNTLTGWSYTTFAKWIQNEDNGLSRSQVNFLKNLTKMMESKTFEY